MTNYYLDPDWAGTQSGTQAQPFASFTSGAWSTINAALATDDVTVYLSARAAGSDTEDVLNATINITAKTANPAGMLTINGRGFYNTNDSSPSWSAYSGSSKARINAVDSQNDSHVKYNKVIIDGVHIFQNSGGKGLTICGDNWTIQNSNIEHGASGGSPLVLLVPTSDSAHEGSSAWCPASSNITIQNNNIHDSVGELIYLGGAGCSQNDANLSNTSCNGKPSHNNISILNNTLKNCGSFASQGDCIDMKGGLTNVTIRGNDIANSGAVTRAIVGQGIQTDGTNQNILIERNYIHNHTSIEDAAIAIVNSWGTPNGYTVRNNIIATITSGAGIHVYGTQSTGVKLFNNTIYNASGSCMSSNSGSTVEVRNNACLSNNGGGAQTSLSGTITSTNNAFSGTWGGTCTSCVAGLSTNAFTNLAGGDFSVPSGSALRNLGMTLTSFSDDHIGTSRPQDSGWDIGARESNINNNSGDSVSPAAPTGLRIN
jgi:hypothetical protein